MTRLLASLILIEGAFTVIWLARLLPVLAAYGPLTLVLLAARALVAAGLLMSGHLLLAARPPGAPIAAAALIASALLSVLETGWRLAPSNLDPTFAWPFVVVYVLYAASACWYLARLADRRSPGDPLSR